MEHYTKIRLLSALKLRHLIAKCCAKWQNFRLVLFRFIRVRASHSASSPFVHFSIERPDYI